MAITLHLEGYVCMREEVDMGTSVLPTMFFIDARFSRHRHREIWISFFCLGVGGSWLLKLEVFPTQHRNNEDVMLYMWLVFECIPLGIEYI